MLNIFSDHNAMKLEIKQQQQKPFGNYKKWRLNNLLLKNQSRKNVKKNYNFMEQVNMKKQCTQNFGIQKKE